MLYDSWRQAQAFLPLEHSVQKLGYPGLKRAVVEQSRLFGQSVIRRLGYGPSLDLLRDDMVAANHRLNPAARANRSISYGF